MSNKYILLGVILITVLIEGCAPPPKIFAPVMQKFIITSEPSGAEVYLYNAKTYNEKLLGKTPLNTQLNTDSPYLYLKAKLEGYDNNKIFLTKNDSLIHFILEDLFSQIIIEGKEKGYSKAFKNNVLEILGLCEETLNSPRMKSGTYASRANTKFSQLLVNHSDYTGYYIVKKLNLCIVELRMLATMPSLMQGTPFESESVKNIGYYIQFIKSPLMILE